MHYFSFFKCISWQGLHSGSFRLDDFHHSPPSLSCLYPSPFRGCIRALSIAQCNCHLSCSLGNTISLLCMGVWFYVLAFYNSFIGVQFNTMKSTHGKYTAQRFFSHCIEFCKHHHNLLLEQFPCGKDLLRARLQPILAVVLRPRQPAICFLSILMCLFCRIARLQISLCYAKELNTGLLYNSSIPLLGVQTR